MTQIPLASPPPPEREQYLPPVEVLPGEEVFALCLTDEVLPLNTHYENGKTRPCFGSPAVCKGCEAGLEKRWLGYLAAWQRYKHSPGLLWITWLGWKKSKDLQRCDGVLRGKALRVVRDGKTKTSPLVVSVGEPEGWLAQIKPVPRIDLSASLAKMWKLPALEFVPSAQIPQLDLFPKPKQEG